LLLMQRPHFNNQLDRNFYYFLNKKLNRVYPYFITALEQYRDIQDELSKIDDDRKRAYIRKRQEGLANQYETQLRDLTTTEGRIFAKLMHRAFVAIARGGGSWRKSRGRAACARRGAIVERRVALDRVGGSVLFGESLELES